MGTVKDVYEILFDIGDRIKGSKNIKRKNLAEYLSAIIYVMGKCRESFIENQIPLRESKELAKLINHADQLATMFKAELPGLAELFDERLPRIGRLMRDADFFIDERPRLKLHHAFDVDSPQFPIFAKDKINETCEEMARIEGELSAYKFKFTLGD